MAGMLIMNMHITIFIAHLDMDQQRRNRYPSISIYHLCSVLHIRENRSCIPNSEDEPSTVPGPFDSIGHTGFQLFFLRPCLADNPGQRLVKRRSWGLPVLSRLG